MIILRAANSWAMNIFIAVCVFVLVVGLPIIDVRTCRKLGLSLNHGISTNPRAVVLQRRRKAILFAIFALYLLANFYLVFMSRAESDIYRVHTDLMFDLANSVSFDLGVFGTFEAMLVNGFRNGWSHIHIIKAEDIMQVLMNTMFYIPMGYLLPYCFRRLHSSQRKTVFICFLISFLTENIQLIYRRGTYDLDDLFFNTLGGLIGYALYKTFAYYVTNPGWRGQLHRYHQWQIRAHRKVLYPLSKQLISTRVTLYTKDFQTACSYYIGRLGFRFIGVIEEDDYVMSNLLQLGNVTLELLPLDKISFSQQLVISVVDLDRVRRRLERCNIKTGEFTLDPYTNHRQLEISAPDRTTIIFTESE